MITSLRLKGTNSLEVLFPSQCSALAKHCCYRRQLTPDRYELAYYLLDKELISLYRLSPIVPPSGVEIFGNDTIAIER